MGSVFVRVVGVSFADPDGAKRARVVEAAEAGDLIRSERAGSFDPDNDRGERLPVVLVRNPGNKFDSNAIEVHAPCVGDDGMLGHLPKQTAAQVAPAMDAGERVQAEIVRCWVHPDHPDNPGIEIRVWR